MWSLLLGLVVQWLTGNIQDSWLYIFLLLRAIVSFIVHHITVFFISRFFFSSNCLLLLFHVLLHWQQKKILCNSFFLDASIQEKSGDFVTHKQCTLSSEYTKLFVCKFWPNFSTLQKIRPPLPCGFRRQRWASGQPGIDLDDAVLQGWRVQGVLDVALSHDAQVTHYLYGCLPQHVVLLVGQSLAGGHHDGVTLDRKRQQRVLEAINCSGLIWSSLHHHLLFHGLSNICMNINSKGQNENDTHCTC